MKLCVLTIIAAIIIASVAQANPLPFETEFNIPGNVIKKSISKHHRS
ncbi:MAG: hypothetical protein R2827_13395 [Bdellovibrionales bacterium]